MASPRFVDWQQKLSAYIAQCQDTPFEWGQLDCALFVAGAVQTITGMDLADGLRGYTTESEGLSRVRSKGFVDHVDVFAKALPETDQPWRGDIVVLATETGGEAVGIMQGRGAYVMTPIRLGLLPISGIVRSFAV